MGFFDHKCGMCADVVKRAELADQKAFTFIESTGKIYRGPLVFDDIGSGTVVLCNKCGEAQEKLMMEREQQSQATDRQHQALRQEQYQVAEERLCKPKYETLKGKITNGENIILYDSIYIPVDSVINDETQEEFSLRKLQEAGLKGWEVAGIIPRTLGIGLNNRVLGTGDTAVSWGAGLGGNVMGGHIILKMETSNRNLSDDFLLDYVKRNINNFLTPEEKQTLSDILNESTEVE